MGWKALNNMYSAPCAVSSAPTAKEIAAYHLEQFCGGYYKWWAQLARGYMQMRQGDCRPEPKGMMEELLHRGIKAKADSREVSRSPEGGWKCRDSWLCWSSKNAVTCLLYITLFSTRYVWLTHLLGQLCDPEPEESTGRAVLRSFPQNS